MPDTLGPRYVTTIRESIAYLHDETARLIAEASNKYAADSQAAKEHSSYPTPDTIFNSIGIAGQLIEFGAEHLSAFSKNLVEPIEPSAALTCIRSMLESCALAAWLVDPNIDSQARASRVFALRYEGMDQMRKLGPSIKAPASSIKEQEARIDAVEKEAIALGFAPVLNKKGKRIGIGEKFPDATELIRDVLNDEKNYRMLSGVAHGHSWAIRYFCYEESVENNEQIGGTRVRALKKKISIDKIALINLSGIQAFTRALWNQCRYSGWNSLHFEEVFENVADRLQMTKSIRFWRS